MQRSAFALFAIQLSVSFAQTPAIKEFERLTQTRDQNIAAITKPINERYVQDLKVLFQKAVKAGDLDAADRIKAVIAIEQGLITPDSVVGRWTQTSPDGQRATILLEEDGKATFVTASGRSYPNTWKVEQQELIISTPDNRFFVTYTLAGSSLRGVSKTGQTGFILAREAVSTTQP